MWNRGRLLLRTPGPVPFGTCISSNFETILSWTCHVYGPFEFRTSLGTSILHITKYFVINSTRKDYWVFFDNNMNLNSNVYLLLFYILYLMHHAYLINWRNDTRWYVLATTQTHIKLSEFKKSFHNGTRQPYRSHVIGRWNSIQEFK